MLHIFSTMCVIYIRYKLAEIRIGLERDFSGNSQKISISIRNTGNFPIKIVFPGIAHHCVHGYLTLFFQIEQLTACYLEYSTYKYLLEIV